LDSDPGSLVSMIGFHAGRPPRNKGMRYPADPPTVEEIVAVMRAAGETTHSGHPTAARPQQPRHHSVYLQGIDNAEIIEAVHARRAPMVPVHVTVGR
jgi:hypothetical protein